MVKLEGNFAVCVEINLDEPLKPFLEWGDHSFGVVYEGISTICFNCGVYGHVRENCPYFSETQNATAKVNTFAPVAVETSLDTEMSQPETYVAVGKSAEEALPAKVKSNIGPWMVMNYKNKKKNFNVTPSGNKKTSPGSRFSPLQVVDDTPVNPEPKTVDRMPKQPSGPTIVQLWQRVQEKIKSGPSNQPQSERVTASNPTFITPRNDASTKPLQDISNMTSCPKTAKATKSTKNHGVVTKAKAAMIVINAHSLTRDDFASSNSDPHPFISMDAQYGHSPPEESAMLMGIVSVAPPEESGAVMDDKAEFPANDEASSDNNLSSSNDEDMVIS